jgi:hypothetical protein
VDLKCISLRTGCLILDPAAGIIAPVKFQTLHELFGVSRLQNKIKVLPNPKLHEARKCLHVPQGLIFAVQRAILHDCFGPTPDRDIAMHVRPNFKIQNSISEQLEDSSGL